MFSQMPPDSGLPTDMRMSFLYGAQKANAETKTKFLLLPTPASHTGIDYSESAPVVAAYFWRPTRALPYVVPDMINVIA